MQRRLHKHNYRGQTSYADGHVHIYSDVTSASPDIPGHTHRLEGATSENDRHSHQYMISSAPSMDANGGHTHSYRGMTRVADRHTHMMEGYTTAYRPDRY